MPRPRIIRRISFEPNVNYFKPTGIPLSHLQEIILTRDEFESLRLIDYEGMEQSKAGKKMKISQATFSRILNSARKKVSEALVNAHAIKIEGGDFQMVQPRGFGRGMGRGRGLGGGRMGGPFAAGPGGVCKCPKCGYEESQIRGQPCMNKKCPKCGTRMTRG
jgi:predicted DNA-binding protein (UPF0251 family)